MCSIKKTVFKISQYSQENTCVEVSFKQSCSFINERLQQRGLPVNIGKEPLRTAASEETLRRDCLGLSFWKVTFKIILT